MIKPTELLFCDKTTVIFFFPRSDTYLEENLFLFCENLSATLLYVAK